MRGGVARAAVKSEPTASIMTIVLNDIITPRKLAPIADASSKSARVISASSKIALSSCAHDEPDVAPRRAQSGRAGARAHLGASELSLR